MNWIKVSEGNSTLLDRVVRKCLSEEVALEQRQREPQVERKQVSYGVGSAWHAGERKTTEHFAVMGLLWGSLKQFYMAVDRNRALSLLGHCVQK